MSIYYLLTDLELIKKLKQLFPDELIDTDKGTFIKEDIYLIYESNKDIDTEVLEEKSDLFLLVIWGVNDSKVSFIPYYENIVPLNGAVLTHIIQNAELQCNVDELPKEIPLTNFLVTPLPEDFINLLISKLQ